MMNNVIKEKIKRIQELFPEERIKKSKNRIEKLWKNQLTDRYPYLGPDHYRMYWHGGKTKEERLLMELEEAIFHGMLNDDYIPSIFTGLRVATIPNMFGAEEVVCEDDYGTKRMLSSVEDIYNLPDPVIAEDSIAAQWLEWQRYFLAETEGLFPIHQTDM